NTNHNFPFVRTLFVRRSQTAATYSEHPAEHGIDFSVILATPLSHECRNLRPFYPNRDSRKGPRKVSENGMKATGIFGGYMNERKGFATQRPWLSCWC